MNFNLFLKNQSKDLIHFQSSQDHNSEFLKAINLFKSQRKNCSLTLEELSHKTKISRNVLIAIENGWKKYIPERTYLISMLKRIETELNLDIGSLNGIMIPEKKIIRNLTKFKIINIDFLNSRIGSLLYFIIMILSILILNSQQRYLIKINSLSTEPVYIDNSTSKE
tara:strand:- start:434 stop:934 length:501 start_codon:yes stop_codon:yes gene_type:complete